MSSFGRLRAYLVPYRWDVLVVYHHLQKLSLRFYQDRQTGEIMSRVVSDATHTEPLIAHNIPDLIANSLLLPGVAAISRVLHDTFLVNGTALENILYGNPGKSEEDAVEAAKMANAHEFTVNLPYGYYTPIPSALSADPSARPKEAAA